MSYRIKQSDTEYSGFPQKVTFKQVFSPGVSINFGLKSSPITFGLGIQLTPELRKILDDEGFEIQENKSLRWFFRISWDIPLIRIKPLYKNSDRY